MKDLTIKAEYIPGGLFIKEQEWSRMRTWLAKHDITLEFRPAPAPSRGRKEKA